MTDREIRSQESELEASKARVLKTARNSQTNQPLAQEVAERRATSGKDGSKIVYLVLVKQVRGINLARVIKDAPPPGRARDEQTDGRERGGAEAAEASQY